MDVGLKAADCMVEADRLRNDLPPLPKKRDALIWAMVAIDTGDGHPKLKTQAMRCAIAAELIGLKPSTLGKYLKELRTGKRPQENPDFSEDEHQLFRHRAGRVRKLALPDGGGWDLVLPVVRGSAMVALPKPASKGRADHL